MPPERPAFGPKKNVCRLDLKWDLRPRRVCRDGASVAWMGKFWDVCLSEIVENCEGVFFLCMLNKSILGINAPFGDQWILGRSHLECTVTFITFGLWIFNPDFKLGDWPFRQEISGQNRFGRRPFAGPWKLPAQKVLAQITRWDSRRFRCRYVGEVPEGSGDFRCRYWGQVSEGSGAMIWWNTSVLKQWL